MGPAEGLVSGAGREGLISGAEGKGLECGGGGAYEWGLGRGK